MAKYAVVRDNRVVGFYDSFSDAVEAVVESEGGEIYRVELIARISREEASDLREIVLAASIEPVEAPIALSKELESKYVVALDRSFSEEHATRLSSALREVAIYLLSPSRPSAEKLDGVNVVGVESSLDVYRFVEDLVERGYTVLLFTEDKRLYTHLSERSNVHAHYVLTGEYSSPEELVSAIVSAVLKVVKG